MAFARARKVVKKFARKRVWKPYTQLKGGRGYSNRMKLYKEVAALKKVINAEKKSINTNYTSNLAVAQVNGNVSGHYTGVFHPVPASGSGSSQRTGASIKLHSFFVNMQITGQSAMTAGMKLLYEVYLVKGTPFGTAADFSTSVFQPTQFISGNATIDMNAQYDPDYFGRFQKIFSKRITMIPDATSSMVNVKTIKFGGKYFGGKGHHLRFDNDTSNIVNGQLLYVIRADRGNCSTSTASTLTGIPITAINTGVTINWVCTHYFYDN